MGYVDTCTRAYNYDTSKFREFSNLMLASRELMANLYENDCKIPRIAIHISNGQILSWLSEDKKANASLLEAYIILSSQSIEDNTAFDSTLLRAIPEQIFECEISELTASLKNLDTLRKDQGILDLAKQVAQMDQECEDIPDWATRLANEISKAKD